MRRMGNSCRATVAQLGVVCLTVLLSTACDGTSGASSASRPLDKGRSASAAPATSSAGAEADAIETYRAMWGDAVEAGKTSDPKHARLDDHASGGALALLKHGMQDGRDKGVVAKGKPSMSPHAVSVGKNKVTLRDCFDSTTWLDYRKDGTLEDDDPGNRYRADATVKRTKGQWKVTDLYLHLAGSC